MTPDIDSRALVLAPTGRDATVAVGLLSEAGIASTSCPDIAALEDAIDEQVTFLVVSEEATRGADLRRIVDRIAAQPSWSDLACILLTHRGGGPERNPEAMRLAEAFGNVTFVERPFHPTTFISAARTAFRGRQRQYEARARLNELRENEERLNVALAAGRLGTWELDLASGALNASMTCKRHFGRGEDKGFGRGELLESIVIDDRPRVEAALEGGSQDNDDWAIECRAVWPDRSIHWLEIRARSVNVGPERRLVGVSREVTEQKSFEENLRALNESLENRVLQRTAELTRAHEAVLEESRQREDAEVRLRQAQKMEAVGQLTGGIAHDFNNLLMAVLGNLDLLGRHLAGDQKAARLVEGALQGARRGATLTQRLLAFARRQDLHVAPTDLGALVEGMIPLLEKSVGPGVEMRVEVDDDLPTTLVDGNQLELALLNLVVNARDAMPDGGTLAVRATSASSALPPELEGDAYVLLSVTDTGCGMDQETIERAVEPFFSTKGVGKGTGLGLSMIHGLAQQLGGVLRLQSTVGSGTTAELWLPAGDPSSCAAEMAAPATSGNTASRPALVLFVDDDALIAMSTVDMLEDLGHEVIEANCGPDALRALEEHPSIELMITDYSMPRMTGTELAQRARRLRPDLPILLATGYAELAEASDMSLPRLSKPYVQDQLAKEIAKLVG